MHKNNNLQQNMRARIKLRLKGRAWVKLRRTMLTIIAVAAIAALILLLLCALCLGGGAKGAFQIGAWEALAGDDAPLAPLTVPPEAEPREGVARRPPRE